MHYTRMNFIVRVSNATNLASPHFSHHLLQYREMSVCVILHASTVLNHTQGYQLV